MRQRHQRSLGFRVVGQFLIGAAVHHPLRQQIGVCQRCLLIHTINEACVGQDIARDVDYELPVGFFFRGCCRYFNFLSRLSFDFRILLFWKPRPRRLSKLNPRFEYLFLAVPALKYGGELPPDGYWVLFPADCVPNRLIDAPSHGRRLSVWS